MAQGIERWKGKVALITGASSGIGRECVRALAPHGLRLVLLGRRMGRLEPLAGELAYCDCEILPVQCDLKDESEIHHAFEACKAEFGAPDIVIHSAGISGGEFSKSDLSILNDCIDVNVRAAMVVLRTAVDHMQGKREAVVIAVSSMSGHRHVAGRGSVVYSASKHALRVMCDGLRAELVRDGRAIKVGMVSPGLVDTEFHKDISRFDYTPLKPAAVADAVIYMLSTPPEVQVCDIQLRSTAQIV